MRGSAIKSRKREGVTMYPLHTLFYNIRWPASYLGISAQLRGQIDQSEHIIHDWPVVEGYKAQ